MKLKWLIILVFLHQETIAASLQVSFIVPNEQDDPFWIQVIDVAQSVANDHNIKLEVYHSDTNRFASLTSVKAVSQLDNKPDFVIYRPIQGSSVATFDILESSRIPFVTLENGFSDDERLAIGKPQQKYKYWLGAISYDDETAGTLLTSALYNKHLNTHPDETMYITGIGGGFESVSLARQASLEKIHWRTGNIVVNQIFPTAWDINNVKDNFSAIYTRYPNTTAFWCVSDLYSLVVLEQLKTLGTTSKQAILIGGFDWLPEALEKIQTGEISASVGGHFLMGGKALLNIVEYHHGNNILLEKNDLERYELIDQNNVHVYLPFIQKAPWPEIDFRQFSSVYNEQKKPIDLTIANLIQAYSQLSSNE